MMQPTWRGDEHDAAEPDAKMKHNAAVNVRALTIAGIVGVTAHRGNRIPRCRHSVVAFCDAPWLRLPEAFVPFDDVEMANPPFNPYAPPQEGAVRMPAPVLGDFDVTRALGDAWEVTKRNFPLWLGVGIV